MPTPSDRAVHACSNTKNPRRSPAAVGWRAPGEPGPRLFVSQPSFRVYPTDSPLPTLLPALPYLSSPLLCSSVPSEFPGDWGASGSSAAAPDLDEDGDDYDDDDDGDDDEEGASRGAWGDDALVSGDPAAIEAAWGHAVDFVVDAGLLEVRRF